MKKPNAPLMRTNIMVRPDQWDSLNKIAGTRDLSASWLLRQIIDVYLKDPYLPWETLEREPLLSEV